MPSDLREGGQGAGRCVGSPGLVRGGGSIHGWRKSGGGLGEGRGGRGTHLKSSSSQGRLEDGPPGGGSKNLEGAFCLVVVFSLAICSSQGRPEKLGVPPPGSCLGLPSAGLGPWTVPCFPPLGLVGAQ